ncbi:MAG TPA: 2-isopropylmalate synthase [bacterium]|nr:2-isopropylmalate synthase [bacterium]
MKNQKSKTQTTPKAKAERVYIFDTTLRDGEQAPGASLNTEEKIKIAVQLEKLGVDIIEAGFAASSPGDFEAVQKVSKLVKKSTVASLCRALKKDIDASVKALKPAKRGRVHIFISSSDIHLKHIFRKTREEALAAAVEAVKYARRFTDDVEFSAQDASRSDLGYLCQMIEAVIKVGAKTVNLPDTVGFTIPEEYARMVTVVRNRVPNIEKAVISVHCHNDLGLGVANSISAIQAGARQVECTINGIGERAGNASLEEIVMALKTRADKYPFTTGVKTTEIYKTSRLVSSLTGFTLQPNKAIVGNNAFAHESGIHQDGMLKYRQTYEIMTPQEIGVPESRLVLGKHSGRHAFTKRLEDLGYALSPEAVETLFNKFKDLADKKKSVYDEDIEAMIEEKLETASDHYQLTYLHTSAGNTAIPTATLKVSKAGQEMQEAATGDGPVDAVLNAIDRVTGFKGKLENYSLKALTQGRDAQGEVTVTVTVNGDEAHGRGVSTDVIEASAKAYLNAVNKLLSMHKTKSAKAAFEAMKGLKL